MSRYRKSTEEYSRRPEAIPGLKSRQLWLYEAVGLRMSACRSTSSDEAKRHEAELRFPTSATPRRQRFGPKGAMHSHPSGGRPSNLSPAR